MIGLAIGLSIGALFVIVYFVITHAVEIARLQTNFETEIKSLRGQIISLRDQIISVRGNIIDLDDYYYHNFNKLKSFRPIVDADTSNTVPVINKKTLPKPNRRKKK